MQTFFYLVIFLLVFGIPALLRSYVPALVNYYRAHHLFGAAPDLAMGSVMTIIFGYLLIAGGFLFAWVMRYMGQIGAKYIKARRHKVTLAHG